ncbi:MAG: hypothetical protein FJ211_08840 [Ignavibacteria bacterium]|nr:hypothetical protein [Ignavibacteria bacterium]
MLMNIGCVLSCIVVAVFLVGCKTASPNSTTEQAPSVMMTGAYSFAEPAAADVVACANYAVDTRQPKGSVKLMKILFAEKQVVAGTNYKLTLSVSASGTTKRVTVIVWSKLDGTREVISYE